VINLKKYIDVKLFGYIALAYTCFTILIFFRKAFIKVNEIGFEETKWKTLIINSLFEWILLMGFMVFIAIISKVLLDNNISKIVIGVFHFFSAFFLLIYMVLGLKLIEIIFNQGILKSQLKYTLSDFVSVSDYYFITYFAMISVIYTHYHYNQLKHKSKLEAQLISAKMNILKAQLQPHFLFNTLNSIHSLIDSDKIKSKNMLVDMSDLLREVIKHNDENLIQLQDELILLNKYLNIKKIRFSDDLKIELDVKKDLKNILVPSMLLQPIVENSIKHGYSKNNIKLVVSIKIFKQDKNVLFIIQNNGKTLDQPYEVLIKKGLGIKNTIERLKTLYDNNYEFSLNNSKFGVSTKISIPYNIAEFKLIKNHFIS
jgi:sensor histidine kinase YesM